MQRRLPQPGSNQRAHATVRRRLTTRLAAAQYDIDRLERQNARQHREIQRITAQITQNHIDSQAVFNSLTQKIKAAETTIIAALNENLVRNQEHLLNTTNALARAWHVSNNNIEMKFSMINQKLAAVAGTSTCNITVDASQSQEQTEYNTGPAENTDAALHPPSKAEPQADGENGAMSVDDE